MIEVLREAGSTNAELIDRLHAGDRVGEGDWIVADRQTAGRGRQGRAWFDGAGNFMGSTVVHLGPGDPEAPSLALVAGLAVHETLSRYVPAGCPLQLKWPNDVLIGRAKLCGILLERIGDTVIVGVGVNLGQAPTLDERTTVALAQFAEPPARDAFAADLAGQFDKDVQRWRSYGLGPIVSRWLAKAHPLGTPLSVKGAAGDISGSFAGLSPDGALQLRLADGTTHTIHAGEVHFAQD